MRRAFWSVYCRGCHRQTTRATEQGARAFSCCAEVLVYGPYGPYASQHKPKPAAPAYSAGRRPQITPDSPWQGARASQARWLVFDLYGRTCWICGREGADEVDHVEPRWKRPELTWCIANMRPSHMRCNRRRAWLNPAPGQLAQQRRRPGVGQGKLL